MTATEMEKGGEEKKERKPPLFHPLQRRFHFIILVMCGFCCTSFMRSSLAMTMTCMVNSTALAHFEHDEFGVTEELLSDILNETSSDQPACARKQQSGERIVVDYGGSLLWNNKVQNLLFSGTFWGALVTVLPSMFIIQRGSPRLVLMGAVATYMLTSLPFPFLAANFSHYFVFASRVVMGFGEGFVLPSINALVANWFPVTERSTAIALYTTGNQIAAVAGNPLAALFCKSRWGWQGVFYMTALVATGWMILWLLTSSNQPSKCRVMTKRERKFLEANCVRRSNKDGKNHSPPYRAILTSPPFLAQVYCQFSISLVACIIQLYLPTYFKDVLLLGVMENGIYTAIPNLVNFLTKLTWSVIMDRLKANKTLTPTQAVRLSQGISTLGVTGSFLLLASLVDCSTPLLALFLTTTCYSSFSLSTSGFFTSLLSLAPRYTATLSSISMFVAMIGRLSAPFGVGILKKTGTIDEWQKIFVMCGIVILIGGVLFTAFGSGDVQPWGEEDVDEEECEMEAKEKEKEKLVGKRGEFQENQLSVFASSTLSLAS